MTDKQIIDYKNLCENYSKEVGCFGTFDGSCIKEQCFTYKLLQKMQQLKAKEQECETLASQLDFEVQKKECLEQECEELKGIRDSNFLHALEEQTRADKLSKTLTEIKEIGKKSMREGKMLSGGWLYQFIEQKISEVLDVENN